MFERRRFFTKGGIFFAALLAVITFFLSYFKVFQPVELLAYDRMLRLQSPDYSENVVIVAMDEKSLREYGPLPWPRELHAKAIEKLTEAKVRAIADTGSQGKYENFILICCNSVGTYSVSAEWRGYHIGTVTFDVIQKPKSQPTPTPTAEPVTAIPVWIKTHAGWWVEGLINDSAYLLGIEYLVKEGIIVMPQTGDYDSDFLSPQAVPAWIKNNAGWWVSGQIDDITYISGIHYLIKVGIIKVS